MSTENKEPPKKKKGPIGPGPLDPDLIPPLNLDEFGPTSDPAPEAHGTHETLAPIPSDTRPAEVVDLELDIDISPETEAEFLSSPKLDSVPLVEPELEAPILHDADLPLLDFDAAEEIEPDVSIHTDPNAAGPFEEAVLPDFLNEPAAAPPLAAEELNLSTPMDPDKPVHAPPAGLGKTVQSHQPTSERNDLAEIREFAQKISIGRPSLDASPAFSVLVTNKKTQFHPDALRAIEEILSDKDIGIRMEDVAVQLSQGKLLIPQISEFAAITIAQKLRDVVDNIEVDLSDEIFKSSGHDSASANDSVLFDNDHYRQQSEEIHDLGTEPKSEKDVFTTHMDEVDEFEVKRILSTVTASTVVDETLVQPESKRQFEEITEGLTRELVSKAFRLRATGVIGIEFDLHPIDRLVKDSTGRPCRAFRLIATGTAVRAIRKVDDSVPTA